MPEDTAMTDPDYVVESSGDDDDDDWGVVDYSPSPSSSPSSELVYHQPEEVRAEIQRSWDDFRRKVISSGFDTDSLLEGVEKVYSTSKAAKFFGRSNQWMYWGLRNNIFTYKNGNPILPERIGRNGRRRFTLPLIREIALSCYRRGNFDEEELYEIMAKILLAEFGEKAFSDT